jgi:hypothetical protein
MLSQHWFAGFAMARLAGRDSSGEPWFHQSQACVSRRSRT